MKIETGVPIITAEQLQQQGNKPNPDSQVGQQIEALFLGMVFKTMQKTLSEGVLSGSSNNLASMMFSQVLGETIAEKGGLGLAKTVDENMNAEPSANIENLELGINPMLYRQYSINLEE